MKAKTKTTVAKKAVKPVLNERHATALRVLNHKNGATVDAVAKALDTENPREARLVIDRLRAKGIKIERTEPGRFRAA